MQPDFAHEIQYQFSRSGGKGGQKVNKVETAVTGFWSVANSAVLSDAQRQLLLQKLAHRLTAEQVLHVKAQTHRTQLSNKAEVLRKMQELVAKALTPKKARIASKPSKAAKEKRIAGKKQRSDIKKSRGKVSFTD